MANVFKIDTDANFETNFHNLLKQSTGANYAITDYRIMKLSPVVDTTKVNVTLAGEVLNKVKGRNEFYYDRLNLKMFDGKFISEGSKRLFHITDVFIVLSAKEIDEQWAHELFIDDMLYYFKFGTSGNIAFSHEIEETADFTTLELLSIQSVLVNGNIFEYYISVMDKNPYWTLVDGGKTIRDMKITVKVILDPPM